MSDIITDGKGGKLTRVFSDKYCKLSKKIKSLREEFIPDFILSIPHQEGRFYEYIADQVKWYDKLETNNGLWFLYRSIKDDELDAIEDCKRFNKKQMKFMDCHHYLIRDVDKMHKELASKSFNLSGIIDKASEAFMEVLVEDHIKILEQKAAAKLKRYEDDMNLNIFRKMEFAKSICKLSDDELQAVITKYYKLAKACKIPYGSVDKPLVGNHLEKAQIDYDDGEAYDYMETELHLCKFYNERLKVAKFLSKYYR